MSGTQLLHKLFHLIFIITQVLNADIVEVTVGTNAELIAIRFQATQEKMALIDFYIANIHHRMMFICVFKPIG